MGINKQVNFITNRWQSVGFYFAIISPIFATYITFIMLPNIGLNWGVLLFFYVFFLPLEYCAIKFWYVEVNINNEEIIIKKGNKTNNARWVDIVELIECLFGQGELFYELKTRDGRKIGFNSSIKNCEDLLKEIENRAGLKFKKRL